MGRIKKKSVSGVTNFFPNAELDIWRKTALFFAKTQNKTFPHGLYP
jgi:hypothetical protein